MTEIDLFIAAIEAQGSGERRAYLDRACGGDGELRARMGRLLAEHDRIEALADQSLTEGSAAGAVAAPRPTPGRLDHYEIEAPLGGGGSGAVYLARDTKLDRIVAIKMMAAPASPEARGRFVAEARAVAAVRHPHVVTIHAVADEGPEPYLVMEYIEGGDLAARLRREGPLGPSEAIRLGIEVASGLAAAHARGLVHGDVKPSNILLEGGRTAKLADFGLAHFADGGSAPGPVAGTIAFMAPEQARGESAGWPADLWGLGGVLYAMLTGGPPYRDLAVMEVLGRLRRGEGPPPASARAPGLPAWLVDLVARLHAVDPGARPASAQAVAEALAAGPSRPARPAARGRRLFLVAGLATAAMGGLGYALVRRTVPRPSTRPTPVPAFVPLTMPTAEELTARPAAADALDRKAIPPDELTAATVDAALPELVGVLGGTEKHGSWVQTVAVRPDGQIAATSGADGTIKLWALATGRLVRTLRPLVLLDGGLARIAFSPDGRTLATSGTRLITLWDPEAGVVRRELKGAEGWVDQLAWHPDGGRLAAGGDEGRVRIWEVDSGRRLLAPPKLAGAISGLAFSPDGRLIAVAYMYPYLIRILDADDLAEVAVLEGHESRPRCLAWRPDGAALATGGEDDTIRLWSRHTWQQVWSVPAHPGQFVCCLAWRADGRMLVSLPHASGDSFWLWDCAHEPPRAERFRSYRRPAPGDWLFEAAWTPEGRHLVVGNPDGTAYVLRIGPPRDPGRRPPP